MDHVFFCVVFFQLDFVLKKVNNATARVQGTTPTGLNGTSSLNNLIKTGGIRKDNKLGGVSHAAARLYAATDFGMIYTFFDSYLGNDKI
jgi:hypothetical protein